MNIASVKRFRSKEPKLNEKLICEIDKKGKNDSTSIAINAYTHIFFPNSVSNQVIPNPISPVRTGRFTVANKLE